MKALVVAFLTVVFAVGALAAPKPADTAKPAAKNKGNTEVSFEDMLVQGKYHFSDEAVTTVEQDKILDSLLGIRKDFKDRIRKSAQQQQ